MAALRVERLDHLGVIASVIKDLGLINMINARLVPDEQEGLTSGEAMAGMILSDQNIHTHHFTKDYQPSSAIPSPLVTLFEWTMSPGVMTSLSLSLSLVS